MKCLINNYFTFKEYTVTDLCKYVGISRQAYYNILSGKVAPKLETAMKIRDYLNIQLPPEEELFTVDDLWKLDGKGTL